MTAKKLLKSNLMTNILFYFVLMGLFLVKFKLYVNIVVFHLFFPSPSIPIPHYQTNIFKGILACYGKGNMGLGKENIIYIFLELARSNKVFSITPIAGTIKINHIK